MSIAACQGFSLVAEVASALADPIDWFAMSPAEAYETLSGLTSDEKIRALQVRCEESGILLLAHLFIQLDPIRRREFSRYFRCLSGLPEELSECVNSIIIQANRIGVKLSIRKLELLKGVIEENRLSDGFFNLFKRLIDNRPKHEWPKEDWREMLDSIAARGVDITSLHHEIDSFPEPERGGLYYIARLLGYVEIVEPHRMENTYSINCLWIHRSMPEGDELIPDQCISAVVEWAVLHPDMQLNFWVDKSKLSEDQINAICAAMLLRIGGKEHARLLLRDIHEIPEVASAVFADKVPLYFRVDLLKAVIGDYVLRSEECEYYVFADVDVVPVGLSLWNRRTMHLLEKMGFVLASCFNGLHYENSFMILNRNHAVFMEAHRELFVDGHINLRAEEIEELMIYPVYDSLLLRVLIGNHDYGDFIGDLEKIDEELRFRRQTVRVEDAIPTAVVYVPDSQFIKV